MTLVLRQDSSCETNSLSQFDWSNRRNSRNGAEEHILRGWLRENFLKQKLFGIL